jgi:hypothetical protein
MTLIRHGPFKGKNMTECEMSSETQYFWFRTTLDSSDSLGKLF